MTKTCNKCQLEKEASEFGKDSRRKDKLSNVCKVCHDKQRKEWERKTWGKPGGYSWRKNEK